MKQFLSKYTVANDARMRRTLFKGALLLVEGSDDERFFAIFIDGASCRIVIAHGKENVIGACQILSSENFPGFLGIVDADFMHAEGQDSGSTNLLLTDWHDVECMMLSGEAFDRLLVQYSSEERLSRWRSTYGLNYRQYILGQIAAVGYLLWHSLEARHNLIFSNLEVKEYVDRQTLVVNHDDLINHVKNKSTDFIGDNGHFLT